MKHLTALNLTAALLLAAVIPCPVGAGEGAAVRPSPELDLARKLNQAFVQVAEQVSPSVVVINVIQKTRPIRFNPMDSSGGEAMPMDELRRFLREMPQEQMPQQAVGEGSGVIIRDDGYILTNGHVVEDAEKIEVRLKDGRTFKGVVRGTDGPSDMAVIKIEAAHLPAAKFADSSKTRVGEFAIAIGAPFALDYSVTFGHVSAKDRSNIPTDEMQEGPTLVEQSFIQTDANINPGNSGGPLVNIDGEVIGINTLIRGLHTGIGFAIPSNLAREVADKLITDGKVSRSWLGVVISSLRESAEFRELVPGIQDGVIIKEILLNGPAARSGLQPADVVTAVDGKEVLTSQQLKEEIRVKKPGQDVSLSVYRQSKEGDKRIKVTVKPQEWIPSSPTQLASTDSAPATENPDSNLGIRVDVLRRRGRGTEGVVVIRVDPNSPAGRTNLREGDVITSVGGQAVTNPKQFYDALKAADLKKGVIIRSQSRGSSKFDLLRQAGD